MDGMEGYCQFRCLGEGGLTVVLGDRIDEGINRLVQALAAKLGEKQLPGIEEMVPGYSSLTVFFDPLVLSRASLQQAVRSALAGGPADGCRVRPGLVRIPVCYGGDYGEDMEFVASYCRMTVDEVIARHTAPVYRVYLLGFLPGFPYLGGLPDELNVPRLDNPRLAVPAGSVGIAGGQTGFYPQTSPGGWRLIGRTPLQGFMPGREKPFLLSAGDNVVFYPVDEEEFWRLAGEGECGDCG
ncbi:MAG: 5-oxoprolinase subunit PxpB [Negativicutes bacterium]|nr:5-oxoprolinase subunit PxpB [Negativicutes bacterium]